MTYTYDRRGRRRTVVQGAMTTTFGYNEAYRVTTEAYSGRVLGGLTVTSTFSSLLQRTGVSRNTRTALSYTYGYDNAGRLSTVSEGTYNATYGYLANSGLIRQITRKQNTTLRMTVTRQYDLLNRLNSISSAPAAGGQSPLAYGYQYNGANERIRVTLPEGSFWLYTFRSW